MVAQFFRGALSLHRNLDIIDCILIRARKEEGVFAIKTCPLGQHVRLDKFQFESDMGVGVHVGNRSSNIICAHGVCLSV